MCVKCGYAVVGTVTVMTVTVTVVKLVRREVFRFCGRVLLQSERRALGIRY